MSIGSFTGCYQWFLFAIVHTYKYMYGWHKQINSTSDQGLPCACPSSDLTRFFFIFPYNSLPFCSFLTIICYLFLSLFIYHLHFLSFLLSFFTFVILLFSVWYSLPVCTSTLYIKSYHLLIELFPFLLLSSFLSILCIFICILPLSALSFLFTFFFIFYQAYVFLYLYLIWFWFNFNFNFPFNL